MYGYITIVMARFVLQYARTCIVVIIVPTLSKARWFGSRQLHSISLSPNCLSGPLTCGKNMVIVLQGSNE